MVLNAGLWVATGLLVVVFGLSAAVKGTQSVRRAVELGMTGVVNISPALMRFIAACEVLGVVGLVVPYATGIAPVLTPLAAFGLAVIMAPAAVIHLRLGEPKTAIGNAVILALCLFVALGRWPGLPS